MCGICGSIDEKGVFPEDIRRMATALSHRGPDDTGLYIKKTVGLGHRRLTIIDLESGRQPLSNEDGTMWIVFNGEIYNYQELREDLVHRGHRFQTKTDTEVIIHLYEEKGVDCVKDLRGMFAFAVWDEKRQRLFAARDHFGQKPFFYVHQDSSFSFASEIKGLLAKDPSLNQMDFAALDQYLSLRFIAAPQSMFRAIRKLPPGHFLTWDIQKGLKIERYWDLHYEPKFEGSEEALVDELEALLIESLKFHMVSDVPVGAFLSGGIDSSLLVAMLSKQICTQPVHTFSIGFPFREFNEAPLARIVADQYHTDHHEKIVVPSLLDTFPRLVWHLDEPADALSVCTFLVSEMARKHVKVVLGGDGGDELFGGYDRYYGNRYASYYAQLPKALRKYLCGPLLQMVPDGNWYKSKGHQLKWLHRLSFLDGGLRYARSLGYFYFSQSMRDQLYAHGCIREPDAISSESCIEQAFENANARNIIDRMLSVDSQIRLPDHPVMILDRMTMAHGLEARSPYMDHKVAEFAARLPMRLKVSGRSLRYIQMRVAERYLPKEILEHRKQGFSSSLPYLLRDEYGMLFDLFLRNSHMVRDGIFCQTVINDILQEHLARKIDHGQRLWLLLNVEVWYRMFIEGMSVEKLSEEIANAVARNASAGISHMPVAR